MIADLLADLAAPAREQAYVGWRTRIPPRWEFDLAAIVAAARGLGLAWPIELGCAEYPNGRTYGRHTCRESVAGWSHRVTVWRSASARQASECVWHELTHAAQAERHGSREFDRLYASYGTKGARYRANPFEVEARVNEIRAAEHPLVRASR